METAIPREEILKMQKELSDITEAQRIAREYEREQALSAKLEDALQDTGEETCFDKY